MYQDVLSDISTWMDKGGEYIELERDVESSLWLVLVKDSSDRIYYGYTLGYENRNFLFELIEYCDRQHFHIAITITE